MPRSTQENRPLLTGSDPDPDPDMEQARPQLPQSCDDQRSELEDEAEDSGLTASGHHIDDAHQQTTNCETLIHLIKGNIGTGILAMPDGVRNSGLYTGVALLPIISAICIHCMHMLVIDCKLPGNGIDIHGYMGILILPLLAISMIRSLKVLAPFSLISNVFLGLGLAITFHYLLQDIPSSYDRPEFKSWKQLPLFLGTSIYAFEGIGVVLPLERKMTNPEDFRGCNGVLNTAMILVTCSYIAVGFFGYLKYGDAVHGSITLNIPPSDALAQLVKILMAVAIYLTYSLMLYVPAEIMWPHLSPRFHSARGKRLGEYAFRAFLVLITFVLAAAIPNIGLFISLVGAMSSSTLAIIFPPIIEIVTFWPRVSRLNMIKCFCIFVFGVVCFVTGTYASVEAIIEYFEHSDDPQPGLVC